MQLKVERDRILLVPESAPEELYLEAILGASHGARLLRVKAPDGSAGAWGALALAPAPLPAPKPAAPPAHETTTEAAPS
jgi:hypothetical protein